MTLIVVNAKNIILLSLSRQRNRRASERKCLFRSSNQVGWEFVITTISDISVRSEDRHNFNHFMDQWYSSYNFQILNTDIPKDGSNVKNSKLGIQSENICRSVSFSCYDLGNSLRHEALTGTSAWNSTTFRRLSVTLRELLVMIHSRSRRLKQNISSFKFPISLESTLFVFVHFHWMLFKSLALERCAISSAGFREALECLCLV